MALGGCHQTDEMLFEDEVSTKIMQSRMSIENSLPFRVECKGELTFLCDFIDRAISDILGSNMGKKLLSNIKEDIVYIRIDKSLKGAASYVEGNTISLSSDMLYRIQNGHYKDYGQTLQLLLVHEFVHIYTGAHVKNAASTQDEMDAYMFMIKYHNGIPFHEESQEAFFNKLWELAKLVNNQFGLQIPTKRPEFQRLYKETVKELVRIPCYENLERSSTMDFGRLIKLFM